MKPRSALLLSLMLPFALVRLPVPRAWGQVTSDVPASSPANTAQGLTRASKRDHLARAIKFQKEGQDEAALREYEAVLLVPAEGDALWEKITALIGRGDIRFARQQWDAALDDYNQVPPLVPQLLLALDQEQRAYRREHPLLPDQFDGVFFGFGLVQGLAARAAAGTGRILLLRGQPPAAVETVTAAVVSAQDYGGLFSYRIDELYLRDSFKVRGTAFLELQEWPEALVDLNAALQYDGEDLKRLPSRDPELYFNRGRAYNGLGQKDKALADFNVAVKLNPAYQTPLRGTSYEAKLAPRDPARNEVLMSFTAAAHKLRGDELAAARRNEEALEEYKRALSSDPRFARAYEGRAKLYRALGQNDRALADDTQAAVTKSSSPAQPDQPEIIPPLSSATLSFLSSSRLYF